MRLAVCIQQDIPRLNVAMEYPVFMRVVNRVCQLCNEFHCAAERQRLAFATGRIRRCGPNHFVELSALDQVHAEVAETVALANFVNWDYTRMVKSGGRFCFSTETFQVRFRGPPAQANHFERDSAIEAFLSGAIHYALPTAANLLEQFVISKVR